MTHHVISTDQAPAPVGPYNQAIATSSSLVFVSGQIALDAQTGAIVGQGDVAAQTEQVMRNIEAILTAAGASFQNVVKTTIFLANMKDFGLVNEIYGRYFEASSAPARACVEVSGLPKAVLVEIECIAAL
jgi:2-iminobutanoate/2-iminopropanoate deaminase